MRVSYQNANLHRGNESTLLRFTEGETRACVLVDAGEGVDLDELLGPDEYLNAIVLTHAHIDHYRTLGANVRHNAPIYVSPATAAILERALPEAQKDNDLGDVDAVLDALEPIDDWTAILDDLEVRPVPAGHTPGAAGFLIRFGDETDPSTDGKAQPTADALAAAEHHHILVTGDFTARPCAGFAGIDRSYPAEIDAVFLNVSHDDDVVETLNESLRTILERAFGGSPVVVATSSLTGVHYAVLLARLAAELERSLPITVVGQAARVYEALDLDVAGVDAVEVFDRPSAVVDGGAVTVAGPDEPTGGSAERLLLEIHDDPAAVFVQLATGSVETVTGATCTTHRFDAANHPPLAVIDDLVRSLAPTQVVVKHARGYALNAFQRRYDRCFTWGTDDEDEHVLYGDGEWRAPGWLGERAVRRIRRKQWDARQSQPVAEPDRSLPSLERGTVDLEAEGVDLATIETTFSASVSNPYAAAEPDADGERDDATRDVETDGSSRTALESAPASGTGQSKRRAAGDDGIGGDDDGTGDALRARVLGDGNGETVLYLLEETELRPGQVVELSIAESDDAA